jgi:hypothetical protein
MNALARLVKSEPVLVKSSIVAAINVALLLPDWRACLASIAVALGGGTIVRQHVTPNQKDPA